MKLYLLRILFILTLPLQIVASDETGFEATEDEDASVPTHLVNCSQAIERVRQSVLDSAEGAENDLRSLSQCFSSGPQAHSATCRNRASEIQTMIQRTMDHQRDVHNYFRSRYPAFLNSLSTEERRIATNCFDHNTGSSDRATDERIRFNNNVGALQYSPTRDRFNISTTQCNRINERWGTFTAPERRAYEADDPIPNNEAYNRLQPFRESNIARLLGDNWVMRHQLSRSEVRELLYRSVANATNNIARFRGRASRWGVADYYKFYEFHQHFSEFLAAQPENLRQEYVRCREESNFFNACAENAAVAVANSVRLVVPAINTLLPGECNSRVNQFILENLPVIGLVDAFIGGQNAQAAYTAGLTTERERDQAFTGNAVQALFAVPITAAGAVVARVATRPAVAEALRIGRGFLPDTPVPSRFVLRGENTPELLRAIDGGGGYAYLDTLPSIAPARNPITGQLLEVTPSRPGEINIFSNRYITGLRDDRVVSLALERAREEVPHLYEQGNGAVLFHGSPSGSLISFGTTRGLGGLRPTGAMRAAGFEPRTGELLRGAGPDGINFDQLSTVTAADLPTALRYGSTFRDTPDADFLATLSRRERALFQEPFPVLYGLRPNPAQVRGYPRHDFGYYEHGIQGGVDFSQIRSIFVPQNRVGLVQQILRDAGLDRTIHVAPIDPIFRAVGG